MHSLRMKRTYYWSNGVYLRDECTNRLVSWWHEREQAIRNPAHPIIVSNARQNRLCHTGLFMPAYLH